jgi:hypothetical protein
MGAATMTFTHTTAVDTVLLVTIKWIETVAQWRWTIADAELFVFADTREDAERDARELLAGLDHLLAEIVVPPRHKLH